MYLIFIRVISFSQAQICIITTGAGFLPEEWGHISHEHLYPSFKRESGELRSVKICWQNKMSGCICWKAGCFLFVISRVCNSMFWLRLFGYLRVTTTKRYCSVCCLRWTVVKGSKYSKSNIIFWKRVSFSSSWLSLCVGVQWLTLWMKYCDCWTLKDVIFLIPSFKLSQSLCSLKSNYEVGSCHDTSSNVHAQIVC